MEMKRNHSYYQMTHRHFTTRPGQTLQHFPIMEQENYSKIARGYDFLYFFKVNVTKNCNSPLPWE